MSSQPALFEDFDSHQNARIVRQHDREAVRKLASELGFEGFWEIWPEKKARPAAEWAFVKLGRDERVRLIDRTEDYLRRRYAAQLGAHWVPQLPHASTFLNGRRWEDQFANPYGLSDEGAALVDMARLAVAAAG